MSKDYINHDVDLYEVLNQFPFLKDRLIELDFDLDKLVEGETFKEYFSKVCMDDSEIDFMLTKLNREVKSFMKKAEMKELEDPVEEKVPTISQEAGPDMANDAEIEKSEEE